jgi:phosphoglycolate/pyridoxal phosphate phosphatase family enzyme
MGQWLSASNPNSDSVGTGLGSASASAAAHNDRTRRKVCVKLRDCLDSNADALGNGVDIQLAAAALAADELIRNIDVFIFDCDGVLWKGDVPIAGAVQTVARLRALGKLLFFITNNSAKSRRGYLEKFTKLGFTVFLEEILCSSFAAAVYLQRYPLQAGQKVFVIGQSGITEELDLHDIPNFVADESVCAEMTLGPGVKVDHDSDVGAVVVGFDPNFNYYKIQYAQLCINKNPGCAFLATNMDCVAHVTDAQEWAEAGAMVGAVAVAVGECVEPVQK